MKTELYNLFQFTFYKVILVSWPKSRAWWASSSWFQLFFKFYYSTLDWFEIELYNLFRFAFYGVIQFHDSSREFIKLTRLTWINSICFFFYFYYCLVFFFNQTKFLQVVQVIFGLVKSIGLYSWIFFSIWKHVS